MNKLAYMIERSAKYYHNQTALICEGVTTTFREVHETSNSLFQGMKKLGVEKGQRVGVMLPNSSSYIITDFSLIKGGYVRVPLNTRLALPELEYIINDSQTGVLIYGEEYSDSIDKLRPNISSVKHFICVGKSSNKDYSFKNLIEENEPVEEYEDVSESDNFQILYTSGTTGKPKGAVTNVLSRITSLNNVFVDELTIQPNDVMIHVASLAHGGGTKVLPHFVKGATNVLMPKFTVEAFLEDVERYNVTTTWMVPTMLAMVIEHPNLKEFDFSSLNTIIYAGAPMPLATLKRAIEVFGNIFIQVYGLSEAPNPDLILSKADHLKGVYESSSILGSAGREITNGMVDIIDKNGNSVKHGEIGEIIISGDNIMSEYWKLEKETNETIRNGWLYTGDLAKKDEEGYIYIVDRQKDMIISGGYNIYPREIEEVLYQHESILEVTVFGVPDKRWGESVKACVVLREGQKVTEEELVTHCQKYLASFKKPRSVDFYKELPKNSNGKISKKELRNKFWVGLEKQVN